MATHGLGLAVSLAVFPVLVFLGARRGDPMVLVGVTIFAAAMVSVFAASTLYHAMPPGPRRQMWRRLDQTAVYLLIAGTYTPFMLGVVRGPWGWTILALVWVIALTGIAFKLGLRCESPKLELATYLGMGWLAVLVFQPLVRGIGWAGFAWLLAGGLVYSIGTIFLTCQSRLRYGHCAWHVAVLGGSACHTIAVVHYGM